MLIHDFVIRFLSGTSVKLVIIMLDLNQKILNRNSRTNTSFNLCDNFLRLLFLDFNRSRFAVFDFVIQLSLVGCLDISTNIVCLNRGTKC